MCVHCLQIIGRVKGAMDFSTKLKFTIPRATAICHVKVNLDQCATITYFAKKWCPTSKNKKIKAIFGEAYTENLLEMLIDLKQVCLENMIRGSLNLEDTPRPAIEYSTNY